eukprot:10092632-Karenia_brevis.AAC.1
MGRYLNHGLVILDAVPSGCWLPSNGLSLLCAVGPEKLQHLHQVVLVVVMVVMVVRNELEMD